MPLSLSFKPTDLKVEIPPLRRSRAQVRLTGVKTPIDTSYQVRVFLHPANVPARPADPKFAAKYLAARFTMWKMGHEDGGGHGENGGSSHPSAQSIYLDVTSAYEALRRDSGPDTILAISFDFTEIRSGKDLKKVRYGEAGIHIQGASLVVNPKAPVYHGN